MADWLKVNHALVRSPKVRGLMRELRCKKVAALGVALSWLVWIDEQTTDGVTRLLPAELDEELGFSGCADALVAIGWAALGEDGCVVALEFGKHCGETAKKRAEDARRQSNKRMRDRDERHGGCHAESVTGVTEDVTLCVTGSALPEKNRIEDIYSEKVQESYSTVDTSCGGDGKARPGDAEEVEAYMGSLPAGLGADPVEVQRAAEAFFNELEAVGWVNGKGVPVRDWRAMARSYLMKWMRNLGEQWRAGGKPVVQRSQQKKNYDL